MSEMPRETTETAGATAGTAAAAATAGTAAATAETAATAAAARTAAARAAAGFVVRPVRPSEHESLGELIVAAYRAIAEMPQSDEYDAALRDVAMRAAASCVLVGVADDGTVLGGVTYVSGPDDPYSEELRDDEAGMRMLAVAPAARRRGVGRALTLECLRRARAAGKRRLVLHTGVWMPEARRMYESIGFRRDPSIDFTPVPGVDLLAYAYEFEPAEAPRRD